MALRQVKDTPTNNFATLNPLDTGSSVSITKGNLLASSTSELADFTITRATMVFPKTGIYYFECKFVSSDNGGYFGIDNAYGRITGNQNGWGDGTSTISRLGNGNFTVGINSVSVGSESHSSGLVIPVVWDADEKKLYTHQGKPSSRELSAYNYSGVISVVSGNFFPIVGSRYTATDSYLNFGQDHTFGGAKTDSAGPYTDANGLGSFYYEPPDGALALCSRNIQSVEQDGSYVQNYVSAKGNFKAIAYTGNGGTQDINFGFQPDLVWGKRREGSDYRTAGNHWLIDSVRGSSFGLHPNNTDKQWNDSSVYTELISNVVSLGSHAISNASGGKYVAWAWKAAGNTAEGGKANLIDVDGTASTPDISSFGGDYTPQRMSINRETGFSIVDYTGQGNGTVRTLPHGLNKKPDMAIFKPYNEDGYSWRVYHSALGAHYGMGIENSNAADDGNYYWNDVEPDHQYMTVYNDGASQVTSKIIAYFWTAVPGYSAFGSYAGNGGSNFIYTGFRPAFIMIRSTSNARAWLMYDSARAPYNTIAEGPLQSNSDGVVYDEVYYNAAGMNIYRTGIEYLSNGFRLSNGTNNMNASGEKHIYMAFAEQPGAFSNAR